MKHNETSGFSKEQKSKINKILSSEQTQPADNEIQHQQEFPLSGNVRAKQTAKFLSIGISTWWLWVKQGRVKPPTKYGNRVSVWDCSYIRELAKNGIPDIEEA